MGDDTARALHMLDTLPARPLAEQTAVLRSLADVAEKSEGNRGKIYSPLFFRRLLDMMVPYLLPSTPMETFVEAVRVFEAIGRYSFSTS